MNDNIPYIIVDNQKLAPIERLQPADRENRNPSRRKDHVFGIVDRVTISTEARKRAQIMFPESTSSPGPDGRKVLLKKNTPALLTYSPKLQP